MAQVDGVLIDTDVLVIGGGAAACSPRSRPSATARRARGSRMVDSWMIGRTGHTAFSNAWTIVAFPDDDIDGILREIVAGNDGIADQVLVRAIARRLRHTRLKDFEAMGMVFAPGRAGAYKRRPTRGLDIARVMYPEGGGLEFAWKLRLALRARGRAAHRPAVRHRADGRRHRPHHRRDRRPQPHRRVHVIKARSTIVATNAITFRSGFVRDITGTGTLLAYKAGARAAATPSSPTSGRARRSSTSRASPSRSREGAGPTPRAKPSCATTSPTGPTRRTCRASRARWP